MKWCLTVPVGVFTGSVFTLDCAEHHKIGNESLLKLLVIVTTQFIKSHNNILTNQNARKCLSYK